MGVLIKDIDSFYAQIKAKAIIILLDWAGTQRALAEKINTKPDTVKKWVQRREISAPGAWAISKLYNSPLTAAEIRPDVTNWKPYDRLYHPTCCPHCQWVIKAPGARRDTSSNIKKALAANRKENRLTKKAK